MGMFFNFGSDLGIDLGTATILVYIKGKGITLREPSVIAVEQNSNKVKAVGEEARQMIGRTPGNIIAIRPLRNGVISDYDHTRILLSHFIKKACSQKHISAPNVAVCVPCEATEVEKRAVRDAAINAGAKNVYLIEEPLAAAIGVGLDVLEPEGNMIIDIGGGTTDVAVISLGGIVVRASIKVAGDKFDETIIDYLRKKYKLMIGERTAENLKIGIGDSLRAEDSVSEEIKGRDLITGLPKSVKIEAEEMKKALCEPMRLITECVQSVLEKTPPELAADISENGIVMTGGGSLLYGLDEHISEVTNLPVRVADDAVECVVKGTGKFLENLNKYDVTYTSDLVNLITYKKRKDTKE